MDKKREKEAALVCSEIGLVRCLGIAKIPVYTGGENNSNSAFYSRYTKGNIQFSSYESEEFIQELIRFGKKSEFKPVLMSYDDRLILNISRHREVLQNYFHFLLPEASMVESLLDKMKFIDLSEEYSLPSPVSVKVSGERHLEQVEDTLRKPYLIKPLYRHHWFQKDFTKIVGSYKKAYVCHTREELREQYLKISQINPHVVIQEYIEGPDSQMYDVNMYVAANGTVKGSIVSQKLRVYPATAGYGCYVVTVDDTEIDALSKQIVDKLQLKGLINVQFKRDIKTGEPKLIEIHTRTSIFDVLGIKSGVNIPAIYYADMTGNSLPSPGKIKSGVKYINISRDLRYILKNRDNVTISQLLKSYVGTKVIDGFSVSDPLPFIMEFWWTLKHSGSLLKGR